MRSGPIAASGGHPNLGGGTSFSLEAAAGLRKRRALQPPAMRSSTAAAAAFLAACLVSMVPRPASATTFDIQWRPATDVRVVLLSGDPDDTYNFTWEGNHSFWWGPLLYPPWQPPPRHPCCGTPRIRERSRAETHPAPLFQRAAQCAGRGASCLFFLFPSLSSSLPLPPPLLHLLPLLPLLLPSSLWSASSPTTPIPRAFPSCLRIDFPAPPTGQCHTRSTRFQRSDFTW